MKYIFLSLAIVLSACDRDRPPEPTADQHQRLDEAEAMLNDMAAGDAELTADNGSAATAKPEGATD